MTEPSDDRSALAIGMAWASTIMGLALQLAVPTFLGYWVDQWLGTRVAFLLIGTCLGGAISTYGLVRLTRQQSQADEGPGKQSKG